MQYITPETYAALAHFIMTILLTGPAIVIALCYGLPRLVDFLDEILDARAARR